MWLQLGRLRLPIGAAMRPSPPPPFAPPNRRCLPSVNQPSELREEHFNIFFFLGCQSTSWGLFSLPSPPLVDEYCTDRDRRPEAGGNRYIRLGLVVLVAVVATQALRRDLRGSHRHRRDCDFRQAAAAVPQALEQSQSRVHHWSPVVRRCQRGRLFCIAVIVLKGV